MTKKSILAQRILGFASLGLLMLPLASQGKEAKGIKILSDLQPTAALVKLVSGDLNTQEAFLPRGASPHTYELKPSDALKLKKADLIFYLEPELYERFASLVQKDKLSSLLEAPGLSLLKERHVSVFSKDATPVASVPTDPLVDPHVWLDPTQASLVIDRIDAVLSQKDPEHKDTYHQNAQLAKQRLAKLDEALNERFSKLKGGFITFHDGYQYLERRYGLNAVGTFAVEPEYSLSLKRMLELTERMKQEHVSCLFYEPQFPKSSVISLAKKTKTRALELDPLGSRIPLNEDFYETLMQNVADSLTHCLAP